MYKYYLNPRSDINKLKRYTNIAQTYDDSLKKWKISHFKEPREYFIPISEKYAILHYPEAF